MIEVQLPYVVPTGVVPRTEPLTVGRATPNSVPEYAKPDFSKGEVGPVGTGRREDGIQVAPKKHNHYFKDVSKLDTIDVYRVLSLFNVTDPCLQHAAKKLLVAGGRGVKDMTKDIQEVIDSCNRFLEMQRENLG